MELDDVLRRLQAVEKRNGEFGRAIGELRDALIVTSEIQRRQGAVQADQASWMEGMQQRQAEMDRWREGMQQQQAEMQQRQAEMQQRQAEMQRTQQMHEQFFARHKEVMSEIEDKLNALIDIIDRMQRPPGTA